MTPRQSLNGDVPNANLPRPVPDVTKFEVEHAIRLARIRRWWRCVLLVILAILVFALILTVVLVLTVRWWRIESWWNWVLKPPHTMRLIRSHDSASHDQSCDGASRHRTLHEQTAGPRDWRMGTLHFTIANARSQSTTNRADWTCQTCAHDGDVTRTSHYQLRSRIRLRVVCTRVVCWSSHKKKNMYVKCNGQRPSSSLDKFQQNSNAPLCWEIFCTSLSWIADMLLASWNTLWAFQDVAKSTLFRSTPCLYALSLNG